MLPLIEKSLAFGPLRLTDVKVVPTLPLLVTPRFHNELEPRFCGPKSNAVALKERVVTANTPVPDKAIFCGDPVASSVSKMEATRAPLAEGANVTMRLQELPTASVVPHWLASTAKSLAFFPLTPTELKFTLKEPVLAITETR